MIKRLFLIFFLFSISSSFSFGQAMSGYTYAAGVKIGKFSSGITGKYFIGADNASAIEASLTVKKNFGTGLLTGFYLKQFPIFSRLQQIPIDGYAGLGAHIATYKAGYYQIENKEKETYYNRGISLGVDAVFGLEYVPAKWPISFDAEVIPMLDLVNPGPEKVELALAVRLVF